jgi:hypothetical protein
MFTEVKWPESEANVHVEQKSRRYGFLNRNLPQLSPISMHFKLFSYIQLFVVEYIAIDMRLNKLNLA